MLPVFLKLRSFSLLFPISIYLFFPLQWDFCDSFRFLILQTYTGWINCIFDSVPALNLTHIEDLFADLSDGVNLASLLEILTGEKILKIRKNPKLRIHKIENNNIVLNFIFAQKIELPYIQAEGFFVCYFLPLCSFLFLICQISST